jgi:hypothetical protein
VRVYPILLTRGFEAGDLEWARDGRY